MECNYVLLLEHKYIWRKYKYIWKNIYFMSWIFRLEIVLTSLLVYLYFHGFPEQNLLLPETIPAQVLWFFDKWRWNFVFRRRKILYHTSIPKGSLHVNEVVMSRKPIRKYRQENCECTAFTVHVIRPTSKNVNEVTSNWLEKLSDDYVLNTNTLDPTHRTDPEIRQLWIWKTPLWKKWYFVLSVVQYTWK